MNLCFTTRLALLVTCCLGLAQIALAQSQQETPQRFNVQLEEVLVLGDNEEASAEYLFGDPQDVQTDKVRTQVVGQIQEIGHDEVMASTHKAIN